jgi:hypothetical protein
MATIKETRDALNGLSSGKLGLKLDAVKRESARNTLIANGKKATDDEINDVLDTWKKNGTEIDAYFQSGISEIEASFASLSNSIKNVSSQFAGITATAASTTASPAAVPMLVQIKTQVSDIQGTLAKCLAACLKINIGAPDPLVNLVKLLNTAKGVVGL